MNNEKEKPKKTLAEKILPWTTLILSVINLIQLIVNFAFLLKEVNPTFWINFLLIFNIVLGSIIITIILVLLVLYFLAWLRNKDRWKDEKEITLEFDEGIKKDIDFEELEETAEKIIEKIRPCLFAEIEGVNTFYWHLGLEISTWKPIVKEAKFYLDKENPTTSIFLCKYNKPDSRFYQIKGSSHVVEWIAKDIQMNSAEIKMWDIILKPLLDDNWQQIILCSSWKDNLYIRKYCLNKDDFLLVYSIDVSKTKCIL